VSTSTQAWSDLQKRYDQLMPNPLVRHTAEVAHDRHYNKVTRFKDLNPTLQRCWYDHAEAVMKALGKL
jgi:hypothetical protein